MPSATSQTKPVELELDIQHDQPEEDGEPPSPREIRSWLHAALRQDAQLTVRFTSQAESRALNLRFLDKDRPANVLAFAQPDQESLAGDIVICPAIVAAEAREAGIPASLRYAHLLVHAALHLQGLDHDRPEAAAIMEQAESEILTSLGLPDPYLVT